MRYRFAIRPYPEDSDETPPLWIVWVYAPDGRWHGKGGIGITQSEAVMSAWNGMCDLLEKRASLQKRQRG